jgi:glycosyltransferase involved in cell wall biosynthesis
MTNKKSHKKQIPVSVIIPMRNSETTLLETLQSIEKQDYPVKEIIIIDNLSTDNSVKIAKNHKTKTKLPIRILINKINNGVGASYNRGVRNASSPLVVFMHSDSSLPTTSELSKLTKPLLDSADVVGSYPIVIVPNKVWETYNFWQKCLFSRAVGKDNPGFNGKFDCIRRDEFLRVGGFDEITYGRDVNMGGEDADLYLRLENIGKIVLSEAKTIHLHYLGSGYKLTDWIKNRKLLARTYGRLIRHQGRSLPLKTHGKGLRIPLGMLLFAIKPSLAVIVLIPYLQLIGFPLLIMYLFVNSRKMYTSTSTLKDPRIITLPFIEIFLLYYEFFWTIQAFLITKRKV